MSSQRRSSTQYDDPEDDEHDEDNHHSRDSLPQRVPEGQLNLTPKELEAPRSMSLNAVDPNVSHDIVRFNYDTSELKFNKVDTVDAVKVHFSMDGILVHRDDPEAVKQQEYLDLVASFENKNKRKEMEKKFGLPSMAALESPDPVKQEEAPLYPETHQLKNQFNFSSRATQTFNNPMRMRELSTLPPPREDLTFNVTQWDMFDTYLNDLKDQIAAREARDKQKATFGDSKEEEVQDTGPVEEDKGIFFTDKFEWATKVMERMVTLNTEEDKFVEYKSSSESKEDSKGGFGQLWRFIYEHADEKTVTAISWNDEFTDLFAVGYGSYDFARANDKTNQGLICCFSLKNTSYPEYIFHTDSGVMCLDFHPEHPSLLCAGLYDGTVLVFDVREGTKTSGTRPIFASTDPKTQHTDPVWEVRWQKDEPEKNVNFFSISSDGRVTNWIMNKNELINEEVVELKLTPALDSEEEEEHLEDDTIVGLAGGSCFDFNATKTHLFIVGTEEGGLYSYSKAYNSQFLNSYAGHHMAVYRVLWNPFHPSIFLSCSADWTVKLWEYDNDVPVMAFDLGCAVSDVAWAPFSSTIFAVGTMDCKVRIFDLQIDKHAPILTTPKLNRTARLTHISFNPDMPILAVGFDVGVVSVIKLSGHMSSTSAIELTAEQKEDQILKLDDLLIINDNQGTHVGVHIRKEREDAIAREEAAKAAAEAAATSAE